MYVRRAHTTNRLTSLERQLKKGRTAQIICDKISMYLSGLTMAARQKASKLSVSDHNVVAGSSLVLRWFLVGSSLDTRQTIGTWK